MSDARHVLIAWIVGTQILALPLLAAWGLALGSGLGALLGCRHAT